ncbi:MAG: ABC transporter substrate-binding protein [Cytophagales bacterium]
MQNIKIGGVPEHFNMPWHYASGSGLFAQRGINIQWTDYSTGTGAMMQDIHNQKLDLAIVLTEGAVSAISNGINAKILQWYTKSSLNWGIHTGTESHIVSEEQIYTSKYAVSRLGSGSHLMAHVHAQKNKHVLSEEQFVIVNSLRGAETALTDRTADVFFWEKYTTQNSVDKGIFRRIGEILTPWPCFVVVANDEFINNNKSKLFDVLTIINQVNKNFKNIHNVAQSIAQKYNLEISQVIEWLDTVEWAHEIQVEPEVLEGISKKMFELQIIKNCKPSSQIIYKF